MKKIQMVDLLSQYQNIKPQVDKAILDVVESSAYINGPEVKSFQAELEEYLQVKHVIPCANGTDALQIAMMGLGLKAGDEVITATFTYVATAEIIALLGLKPVLVDVDPDTFGLDPEQVRKAITSKTKAIVPVHLFGQCANMDAIMEIAKINGLFVVEDTAQAIGSNYTFSNGTSAMAGTIGDVGTTSFFPSKNLGCFGDGGALFTNNDELAKQLRIISNHGQTVRYYHDMIGVNSRLDSMQAAVLRCKLPHLNEYIAARQKAADFYDAAFSGISELKVPQRTESSTHVFHQYTLQLDASLDRNALIAHLKSKDIPAMIYYPVALHMQKAYLDERYSDGHFPITEKLVKNVFSLPMHTELELEQLKLITSEVINFINNQKS
jgi:UDP-2-acetamido-2-deoxy-ribo-hexuluronate aminotransferase